MQIARAIALEATLSFLGLGVPVTEPSLGLLIANGYQYMLSGKYWISFYPGRRAAGDHRRHQPRRRPAARRAQPPKLRAVSTDSRGPRPAHAFLHARGRGEGGGRVSFAVERGEVLGLVGESGSGKTVTGLLRSWAWSIRRAASSAGSILFEGRDLASLPERGAARVCAGNRIAMIFQDPMMTLNPVLRIDTQMIEAVRAHEKVSSRRGRATAPREALGLVGIPSPGRAADQPIRTSSPAACASASRSPSRCCTGRS